MVIKIHSKINIGTSIDKVLLKEILKEILEESLNNRSLEIPLSIFSKKLGILETLVKYLKEEKELSLKQIGKILNKDNKMLWNSYNNASKKYKERFDDFDEFVPLKFFVQKRFTSFESIVLSLRQNSWSLKKISRVLDRSYQTIWTTYRRVKDAK